LCNNFLANTNSGDIWIEDYVFFGKNVCLITGTHDYTKFDRERVESYPRSGQNIILRRGAWIATNATIIGPCEVGVGAVVAAGSVVTENVPPYVVVAGVPARVVKVLQP
jgi:acetyltransferase-like isoleucine patch superfamily enzyme